MADLIHTLADAIAHVESRGNYSAIGKPNKKGQRAYGKYQIMNYNVPVWTKEVLGYSLTPTQFLESPQVQDTVARAKLTSIYQKYGNPDDVASVWFSGRPMKQAGNAADITGTTTPKYVQLVRNRMKISSPDIPVTNSAPTSILPRLGAMRTGALNGMKNVLSGVNAAFKNLRSSYSNKISNIRRERSSLPKYRNLGVITTPFGGQTRQERFHPGIDIANRLGTPIRSPVDGVVTRAEGGHKQGENNFGNLVVVADRKGDQHQFSHLNRAFTRPGQSIQKGQPLAEIGNSGATYSKSGMGDGANLDYRIMTKFNKFKNPMTYLKDL